MSGLPLDVLEAPPVSDLDAEAAQLTLRNSSPLVVTLSDSTIQGRKPADR